MVLGKNGATINSSMDGNDIKKDDSTNVALDSTEHGESSNVSEKKFLTRHIRTGKGPDGRIWVKIYPPLSKRKARWEWSTKKTGKINPNSSQ